jgi:amino acid adenylation domain-containing protein
MTSRSGSDEFGLSEQGKELLGFLLAEEGFHLPHLPNITSREEDGPPPLSFAQERLWFLCQFDPQSIYYNIPMALLCTGTLSVTALEKSLTAIVERHEVLRAVFRNVGGHPVQHIAPVEPIPLPFLDLRHLSSVEREARKQQLIMDEAQRPFDLEQGPLLRAQLLCLDEKEHILLLTIHHIVADGISYGILMRELQTLYSAFVAGKPPSLPDLPFQFADFAHWQRQWLQGEVLEQKLNFWRQRLGDAFPILDLPADYSRPSVQTYWGSRCSRVLSEGTTEALKALSRKLSISLFTSLLAVFEILLYRYTNQEDIVLGSPVANRNYPGVEGLIGLFINTLVLRADLSGDPTFEELAVRIGKVVLGAYEHQDLPFEKLVEALHPERDMRRTPFFQVMFNFQTSLTFDLNLPDLHIRLLEQPTGIAKFDLTMDINEVDDRLLVAIEYNTDLFKAGTAERMLEHFERLVEGIIQNPARPISALSLLSAAERCQMIEEWNDTRTDYPRDVCVHHLFEEQARRSPNAIAVSFADSTLTYRELSQQTNQVARYLQGLGVGPSTLVGVCMERSARMVVGFLGILKSGGAYVPFDPSYPKERLSLMFADTQVPVVLTEEATLDTLPDHEARVVCLDRDWETIAHEESTLPDDHLGVEALAYVMYTSGSTGHPKGIAVPHRAINRLVRNTDYVQLGSGDRVAQVSNASFDAATFEIWGALLNGASLIGFCKDELLSLQDFATRLRERQISALFLTTALFNEIAQTVPSALRSVRHVLFGGEAVRPRWVQEVIDHGPPERLLHVYGPTENTTFTSWYRVQKVESGATIPIGCPITNTQIYILDAHLQPVPVGVPGGLYIGGDGLAWGYLNRPALTAERFIPSPFALPNDGGDGAGSRLYETGDNGRYLPDGSIEFIGRKDHQVKVHGFRIELSEIEIALGQHPDIQAVVALAREDWPGEKQLVAYIVPEGNNQLPTFSALRKFLRLKLPAYMIPTAFVVLEQLPLTPNGKVDRRALPVPKKTRAGLETKHVAPRNPVEEELVKIWVDVLQIERIGVHDNFFELGGHSLLATRVLSQVQATFQVPLPLRILFEMPTVADMAQEITRMQQSGQSVEEDWQISPADQDEEDRLLAEHLDQLSDAEVDSLLEQMLRGSGDE